MAGAQGKLVIDVRSFAPDHRRALIFSIVDTCVGLGCTDEIVILSDHDPSGLGYQIDLRRETRGLFEFTSDLRSDGAWVAFLQRKRH